MRVPMALAAVPWLLGAPMAQARTLCCGQKLGLTFAGAGLEIRALSLFLWGAAIASIVIWIHNRRRAPDKIPERTLALLRGWRAGGPLLGLAGTAYLAMNFFVAVYAYPPTNFRGYAPGLAEMSMVMWAGAMAGGFAALTYASLAGRVAAGRFRDDDQAA
jgi:hypothetical protein